MDWMSSRVDSWPRFVGITCVILVLFLIISCNPSTSSNLSDSTNTPIPVNTIALVSIATPDTPMRTGVTEPTATPKLTPTDTSRPAYPAPTLVNPAPGVTIVGKEKTEFSWEWDGDLQEEQAEFDLRIWRLEKPPSTFAIGCECSVLIDTPPDGFGDYLWQVAVVRTDKIGKKLTLRESPVWSFVWSDAAPTPTPAPINTPTPTSTYTLTLEAVVVHEGGLNLRSGPGVIYDPPIGYLSTGEILDVIGRIASNQWVQVVPVSRTNTISGWVRALPEYVKIYVDLNSIPITEAPPTPTSLAVSVAQTPSPLPSYPAPVLAAPDEGADVAGTFPPMYWNWDGELAGDEYFEVRVWHTDVPYPIALGWVKEKQFDYNITGERHGKYHWSVIIVKDEYIRTKDWYDPSKWPYPVWEHDPAVEDSSIHPMSQESEVRSFFYTPPPGVGTGGPGPLSPTCETNPDLCD